MRRLVRVIGAFAVASALISGLAACSANDALADDYREGSGKGYIAGDSTIVEIPIEERGDPVVFAGVTDEGDAVSDADYAGEVLVVNFWYAACGPCRAEAPFLEEVAQKYTGEGAEFLGVNIYDQPATAQSFAKTYGITYPSVIAVNDGAVKLAFAAVTPIQSSPTTLVLDGEGRVAVRIIGQVKSASILSTLVADTLAETS